MGVIAPQAGAEPSSAKGRGLRLTPLREAVELKAKTSITTAQIAHQGPVRPETTSPDRLGLNESLFLKDPHRAGHAPCAPEYRALKRAIE